MTVTGKARQEVDKLSWHYSVYGLQVQADLPVPGLAVGHADRHVDLTIETERIPHVFENQTRVEQEEWRSAGVDESGTPRLRITQVPGGNAFRLQYADGCEFVVNRAGEALWMSWPDGSALSDALPYLRGPVLGAILRLRRVVALHASAVCIEGRAILLMGPAGLGKSTTAAALAQRGHPVLSDDVVALTERSGSFHAQPGYPNLCLWPDSVGLLYGNEDRLPRITPAWEKRYLDLAERRHLFVNEPQPLGCIFLLQEREAIDAPHIARMQGHAALMELVANVYVSFFSSRSIKALELEWLARIVATVPVRRIVPPRNPAHLSRLCEAIVEHATSSRSMEIAP